jgi:predicted nucleic acid-binding protein
VIFVDTSFFFPLLSAHDRDHLRVREVFEGLDGRRLPDLLLTTNTSSLRPSRSPASVAATTSRSR